ncbi:BgTH12-07370 [Blumeria graminis f. sp. triticale]|uniref:Bgt-4308 n=3 Tax=Blumeria graminis TaxID=34373 RepID=A0A381LFQ3_BLUGR|nr:hypothetical protein BGT96224_4308 [Blumeria graminis f. sp. tritici 96224]CAD6506444.1 BgTH12-07370 [Blumeria graminis f. sp. triticale]VDB95313.1 Bgt-4308 [Blumeria graminis f. sp. tritici]
MGANPSKTLDPPQTLVWKSDTPVQFSQTLLNSLQASPESDSTRAKALELQIQSRVNAELQRLQSDASKEYTDLQARISAIEPNSSDNTSAGDKLREMGREAVQSDIRELQHKLQQRKRVREIDEGVAVAKEALVTCLTENDRRPLDCWAKVQKFKEEVARLENEWVEKVVR